MKKKFLALGLGILTFCIGSIQAKGVNKVKQVKKDLVKEGVIVIQHEKVFKKFEYPPVVFNHQKHVKAVKEDCKECHLVDKEKKLIFDFLSREVFEDPEKAKVKYHEKCVECHKKFAKKNQKTGPTGLVCGDCHIRKAPIVKYPVMDFDFYLHDKHEKKLEKLVKGKIKGRCDLCHHTYDLKKKKEEALKYEKGKEESCYYCHDFTKERKNRDLVKIINIAKEDRWCLKRASHYRCLNCHLEYKEKKKDTGPIECAKCHTGKYRTVKELAKIKRPDRKQKEEMFLFNKTVSKMKGVPFDHKSHEYALTKCRDCHHERLEACRDCHTPSGDIKGGYVSLVTALHSKSKQSCVGCHYEQTKNKDCYGCHYFIGFPEVKNEVASKRTCNICHSGKKKIGEIKPISLKPFLAKKIDKDIEIKILEKEYKPAKLPHEKIVKKLLEISNKSKLATYFHQSLDTLCMGCHHKSLTKAEQEEQKPPLCKSCHSVEVEVLKPEKPKLQAAYHVMCIKCHIEMDLKKGLECTDCHKEKEVRPKFTLD